MALSESLRQEIARGLSKLLAVDEVAQRMQVHEKNAWMLRSMIA